MVLFLGKVPDETDAELKDRGLEEGLEWCRWIKLKKPGFWF